MKAKLTAIILLFFIVRSIRAQELTGYVQPMSGTAASTTPTALKHGEGTELNANTIPAVGTPFAMTQWTPQTRATENKCVPPYLYQDSLFSGIRASHWLSGSCTQDYGSVTIMPFMGKLKSRFADYQLVLDHRAEKSSPYEYSIAFKKAHMSISVTATPRSGMIKITANKADSLFVLVTPNSDFGKGYVHVDPKKNEISGYNPAHRIYQGWGEETGFKGHFVIRFQKKMIKSGTFKGGEVYDKPTIQNQSDAGGFVGFKMKAGEVLYLKIGTSFSSLEGARKNLDAEIPFWDYELVRSACKDVWEKALGAIRVETVVEKDKRIFYTAMYHALQHPRLFSDADGTYPRFGAGAQLERAQSGEYFDDFSMWDTYRAQLPLMELIQPEKLRDMVNSLIIKGQQGGWLPIFPCWNSYTAAMIGDHSVVPITSAFLKGFKGIDGEAAYELLRRNAFERPERYEEYKAGKGRRALDSYLEYGYIPVEDSVPEAFHKNEQVSRTLEYAYDDYAVGMMAKALGKDTDHQNLAGRSMNYKHVFDPTVGLMRGRYADRSWISPFFPDRKVSYITEGTPRQYTFYVPHDVPGLAVLMGGKDKLEKALDSLFLKNEYWHGNEPGHQIPFMYSYTNSPHKTSERVREILENEYSDGPGGLSGNDDAGQMSAWYVFASLGFYPLNPISGEYMLSTPIFDRAVIRLAGGASMQFIRHNVAAGAGKEPKILLNGHALRNNVITYTQLIRGGKLEFFINH